MKLQGYVLHKGNYWDCLVLSFLSHGSACLLHRIETDECQITQACGIRRIFNGTSKAAALLYRCLGVFTGLKGSHPHTGEDGYCG